MKKRTLISLGFLVLFGVYVVYVFGYWDEEVFRSKSLDGQVQLVFRKHPALFGGVLEVSSIHHGKTAYLYTIYNDSCAAPTDLRVVWDKDSRKAAFVSCDGGWMKMIEPFDI
jgi:hypothetical protein